MDNKNTTTAISYAIYLIIALIFIITIIAIINYTLYSVYSINAIRKEYTYNNSPFFKLNQIYNYMLINYVYLLNKNKDIRYKRTNEFYKEETENSGDFKTANGTSFYSEDNNNDFRDIIYYYDYPYIEKQIKKNKDDTYDDTYVYIKSPVNKKDNDDNIIFCKYEKINEDLGFFENISRYLWEFFSSFSLYDDKATYLYVHLNNRYYEMIIFVIFIILFIFMIKVIITFASNLLSTISDKKIDVDESIFRHIYNNKFSTIIIIISVLLYCMLHSILYKKIFIENVYDRIYKMYNEILKIDLQMQSEFSEMILYYNKNNKNDEIKKLKAKTIDNLKYLSHNGHLVERDTIVDFNDQTKDADTQIDLFTKKILLVNKKFNVGNHTKLYNLKEYIEECINYHCESGICYGPSGGKEGVGSDATTDRSATAEDRLLASQLFIIMVYMYVINNNKEDPYIILKLNKLILGDIVKVGDKNIDKDIEYTLTLRSLLYEKLEITDTQNQLNNIRDAIKNQILINYLKNKNKEIDFKLVYDNVIDLINKKIDVFVKNVDNANDNLNFFTPVYFFNLYLALEMGVNFIVILIILYAMLYYDKSTPELKEKIKETIEWIKVAKDEIETAIYGVI
jgi:hypothetical protein